MTTLNAWCFHELEGAVQAERTLATLSALQQLPVDDASLVIWPMTATAPHTRSAGNIAQLAPLAPYFWGLLYGHVFAAPLLGDESETHYLREVGIDMELTQMLRHEVLPGNSALIIITEQDVPPELVDQVAGGHDGVRMFHSHLTTEHAVNLHRVFGR